MNGHDPFVYRLVGVAWVLLGALAGLLSGLSAYSFHHMDCGGAAFCGLGTVIVAAVEFLIAALCLAIAGQKPS